LDNSVGVFMGASNTLRVLGAKVTSVSGNVIDASVSFGNTVLNFVLNTDASTKINGKLLSDSAALSNLKSGDSISFGGDVSSSSGSQITLAAKNIISQGLLKDDKKPEAEKTSFQGKITAINTSANSLTLKLKSGVSVEVDAALSAIAPLTVGQEVKVDGTLNSAGTIITASKISVDSHDKIDDNKDGNKDQNENKDNGGFWGKIRNWLFK
jgi:hypothetical protein